MQPPEFIAGQYKLQMSHTTGIIEKLPVAVIC